MIPNLHREEELWDKIDVEKTVMLNVKNYNLNQDCGFKFKVYKGYAIILFTNSL